MVVATVPLYLAVLALLASSLGLGLRPALAQPRPLLVTVDDLPVAAGALHQDQAERERITRELLAVLAKHRITAVGLVTWSNVRTPRDERLLQAWLDAGHELGNHSDGHLDYTSTDTLSYIADVERGRAELAAFLEARGRKLRFFRFPYLREGDTAEKLAAMRRYLERSGQRNLPVSIDDQDWSFEKPWVEARRRGDRAALDSIGREYQMQLRLEVRDHEARGDELFERLTPQILLLHANEVGTAQWDALFTWLAGTGHRFAAADEVLSDSAFAVPHEFVGRYGSSLWDRLQDQKRRQQARQRLLDMLEESAAAWNRGDFETFCSDYAEDALFISPSGITRGRQAVLDRYRAKFGEPSKRGQLSFEVLEVRLTSGMEASVLGSARPANLQGASLAARWRLTYPDTTASGLTLLVLRPRRGGKWEIVQDASM